LSSDQEKLQEYMIIEKNKNDKLKDNYKLLKEDLKKYNLYKLKTK